MGIYLQYYENKVFLVILIDENNQRIPNPLMNKTLREKKDWGKTLVFMSNISLRLEAAGTRMLYVGIV